MDLFQNQPKITLPTGVCVDFECTSSVNLDSQNVTGEFFSEKSVLRLGQF